MTAPRPASSFPAPGQAELASVAAPRSRALVQYALLAGPLLSMLDSSIVNAAIGALGALALPAARNMALEY